MSGHKFYNGPGTVVDVQAGSEDTFDNAPGAVVRMKTAGPIRIENQIFADDVWPVASTGRKIANHVTIDGKVHKK